ncbi:uncharacterized protein MYCFIDRAFT_214526 [Pseudocercospora fijiensis CIRAD86]|uniref:AB hydrolase-1 domain-containing protein n=1 Tax=Pseudocercospora fijiensis (strain CIRAD86) TaxID=383855 RepID=M3B3A6_PSEFD|nr:uncharacterized protein MYCFIDRAFT_214526 [Pseudocercospora fijiensis CIRAD86]EME83857.1 hypothetical protein MYCFIDRAFT_214526 [Pseudocercospora fijiensis CIRAD86]
MLLALLAFMPFDVAHAIPQQPSSGCIDFEVPLKFEAQSLEPSFPPFEIHYQAVDFLVNATSRDPRARQALVKGINSNVQVEVTIAAKYCPPKGLAKNVTQILTHGVGFDQRDLPALKHITPSQKIVHVEHSFGTIIANLLVVQYPKISDGLVQTGFSKNASSHLLIAANAHLARAVLPGWSKLSSSAGYLTWGDELANQYNFFHYGAFVPEVLAESEKIKQPTGVGEILTIGSWEAKDFSAPVLVFAGEYDQAACESYCTTTFFDDETAPLFPAAKPFDIYVQPDAGHGMNLHHNATGAYKVIQDCIEKNI